MTTADVARAAGVSKAQASRALGGYGAVSEQINSRVWAAAERLGYHPNMIARSMNTGRSQSLGVVVGDIENPFFSRAVRGITDTAAAAGYDVILVNTGERPQVEVDAVRVLLEKQVDGFVIAPVLTDDHAHLQRAVDSGRPVVLLDRGVDGLEVDTVRARTEEATFRAVTTLVQHGHERIGFISTINAGVPHYRPGLRLGSTPVAERLSGLLRALDASGTAVDHTLLRLSATSAEDVHRCTRELLTGADPATAIIASDSVIALSVLEELREMRLRVPRDVSFVSFDDLPWTRVVTPALTVVAQPVHDMGVAAAEGLLARLEHRTWTPPDFEAFLVERESVAPARPVRRRR